MQTISGEFHQGKGICTGILKINSKRKKLKQNYHSTNYWSRLKPDQYILAAYDYTQVIAPQLHMSCMKTQACLRQEKNQISQSFSWLCYQQSQTEELCKAMLMTPPALKVKLPLKKLCPQFDRSSSKTCHPSLENRHPHTIFHTILPQEQKRRDGVCLGPSDNFTVANPCVFEEKKSNHHQSYVVPFTHTQAA